MKTDKPSLGRVHSTDSFSSVDGPGLRFVVFMQGCLLKCQYCQNRDTWGLIGGDERTTASIIDEFRPYQHYAESHGGITVSGGEPTLQSEFVTELFTQCKANGIHTCLDTNGFVRDHNRAIDDLLAVTDMVLLDLKAMDDDLHIALTGVSNRHTKAFAHHLQTINKPTWVRNVLVSDMTATEAEAQALGEFIKDMDNVQRVELLPYHELGVHKWAALGETYPLAGKKPPHPNLVRQMKAILSQYHGNVVV